MKPDKQQKPAPKKQVTPTKVFDVSRPGRVPASPTSKPVITGHRPEAQAAQAAVSGIGEGRPLLNRRKIQIMPTGDIEVVETNKPASNPVPAPSPAAISQPTRKLLPTEEDKDALAAAALDAVTGPPELGSEEDKGVKLTLGTNRKTIEPITESAQPPAKPEPAPPAPEVKPETQAEPQSEPESAVQTEETKASEMPEAESQEAPQEPTNEQPAAPPDVTDSSITAEPEAEKPAVVPPLLKEADGGKEEQGPVVPPEEAAPEPVIEPLFDDSGDIVVSKHEHHRQHHGLKVFGLIILILLLAAVALDVALDLGLLNLEGIPHTDFLEG